MPPSSVTCSRCSFQTRQYVELECRHYLCADCFEQIMKWQKLGDNEVKFRCEICLKSQRVSSLSHFIQPEVVQVATKLSPKNNRTDLLYCFNCNSETFTTHEYLRGMHKGHRVKTYGEAAKQLREHNLKSISVLEFKTDELRTQQQSLEHHLKTVWEQYKLTETQISLYYDNIMEVVRNKRGKVLEELHQLYRNYSNQITRAIDQTKSHLLSLKGLTQTLKGFVNGQESIDALVTNKQKLTEAIELVTVRPLLGGLPKLVESFDLAFHINNSVQIEKHPQQPANQPPPILTDAPRRTVKLVEKVRNRLNFSSDLLFLR